MAKLLRKGSGLLYEIRVCRSIPAIGRVMWLVGCAALTAAAGLTTEPRLAQATECANAGAQTTAPDDNAVVSNTACGNAAVANGGNSTAVGNSTTATGINSAAVGSGATASGDLSTAVGSAATATGPQASAFGVSATAGSQSTALGRSSQATFSDTAVGFLSRSTGGFGVAVGLGADSGGLSSIAIGGGIVATSASGDQAIAIGSNAAAVGTSGVAVGFSASAVGSNSVALGSSATAAGSSGTAVGANAQAGFANSTAIGNGAVATRSNQQTFGTATNTYTMSGITSAASAAAQTGVRQVVTSDASGNLATSSLAGLGIASSSDISLLQSQIDGLVQRDRQLASGIAISMALAQPMLQAGQTVGVRVGWGNFGGSNAVGVSAAGVVARGFAGPTTSLVVDAGVGFSSSQTGGRVGVTLGW